MFDFYFTNEKWLIKYNNREFFVEKIGDKLYDNYQLEDLSKWAQSYLKNNVDKNIIGMEISTEYLYNSTRPNFPDNSNDLIKESDIKKFITNDESDYKRTLKIYYLTQDSSFYRNSVGNGNKEYEELKQRIKDKICSNEGNIDIQLMIFDEDVKFERFIKQKQKGYSYQIFGIPYDIVEQKNAYF